MAARRICIIGGGIAGLTAAYRLTQQAAEAGQDLAVTLLEAGQRLGGKLRTSHIAGFEIDEGADAFITRVPYALDLAHELDLKHSLVSPATSQAYLWNGSGLSPIVKQQILGVPLDLDQLADSGLVSSAGMAAARQDLDRTSPKKPELAPDATVGSVLRQRLGDEISEKLVFPLIGSINAGNCDYLDVRTTAPLIAEAAQQKPQLDSRLVGFAVPHAPTATTTAKQQTAASVSVTRSRHGRISPGLDHKDHAGRRQYSAQLQSRCC